MTIRADHLGNLASLAPLTRLVEQGLFVVNPLEGDALRATIEGPAAAAGLRLESGLVDLLVRETEGEPGALPLLELDHLTAQPVDQLVDRLVHRGGGGPRP